MSATAPKYTMQPSADAYRFDAYRDAAPYARQRVMSGAACELDKHAAADTPLTAYATRRRHA